MKRVVSWKGQLEFEFEDGTTEIFPDYEFSDCLCDQIDEEIRCHEESKAEYEAMKREVENNDR